MFDLEPTAKLICLTNEQLDILLDYAREYFEQKHNNPQRQYVSIKEAAEILDVSERSVHNYKKEGKIEFFKPSPGKVYVVRQSLHNYLEEKSQKNDQ